MSLIARDERCRPKFYRSLVEVMSKNSEPMCSMKRIITVTVDVILVGSVALFAGLVHLLLTPYHRGFYCDDDSIRYPFHDSTIPSTVLYVVGFGLNFLVIFVVEGCLPLRRSAVLSDFAIKSNTDNESHDSSLNKSSRCLSYLCAVYNVILPFLFGAAVEFTARGISKYTLGRLRPHFLSVCQPDFSAINCSTGYITNYVCTGDPSKIEQARLSFPSGHASFSTYSMVFLILYIQIRWKWRQVMLLRPWIQMILFLMAFYTCISRVFDNKHHWSDVLAGAIWGMVVAFLVVFKVSKLPPRLKISDSGTCCDVVTKL